MQGLREHEEAVKRVLLTLVSRSDKTGLVTRCTLTDLIDFASIPSGDTILAILMTLEIRGDLVVLRTSARRRDYQLLGRFETLRPRAAEFLKENITRVAEIRAERSGNGTGKTIPGSTLPSRLPTQVEVKDVEMVAMMPNQPHQRWRFTVVVDGRVTVKDCILIEFPKPFVAGPSRGPVREKESYVVFSDSIKHLIIEAMRPYLRNRDIRET